MMEQAATAQQLAGSWQLLAALPAAALAAASAAAPAPPYLQIWPCFLQLPALLTGSVYLEQPGEGALHPASSCLSNMSPSV